jgi:hypothetical protein
MRTQTKRKQLVNILDERSAKILREKILTNQGSIDGSTNMNK